MSHIISIEATTGTNYVVDLRRTDQSGTAQTGEFYKACKLKVSAVQDGGAKATAVIAPIVVQEGGTVPSPASLSAGASAKALTWLDSTLHPSVEIGQSYGPGYSPGVFREIVATHVMITPAATGLIEIVVD